jgi:hypothetical protein
MEEVHLTCLGFEYGDKLCQTADISGAKVLGWFAHLTKTLSCYGSEFV